MLFFVSSLVRTYLDQQRREDSRLLDELLRRDFSGLKARLQLAFPKTKVLPERYVDWVGHWADELTGMYARPLVRVFRWPATLDAVAASRAMEAIYETIAFDSWAHAAHRMVLCQQTILCAAWPDGPGRVRLEALPPWRYEVIPASPMRADSLDGATVRLAVPIATRADSVTYVEATITSDVARVEVPGQGTWGLLSADGSNPMGRLPFVALRLEEPDPGRFDAPLNSPLLNAALSLCEQSTDETLIARHQGFAQRYLSGVTSAKAVDNLDEGPDVWMMLRSDGEGPPPVAGVAQGQLQLDQLSRWREATIRERCAFASISPDAFVHTNTAATAEARRMRMQERADMQHRIQPIFRRWEGEMARLISDVLAIESATRYPRPDSVSVTWTDWEIPSDPQAEAQAVGQEIALGLTTAAQRIAAREGLPYAVAEQRVKDNLALTRDVGTAGPTAGAAADAGAGAAPSPAFGAP